MLVLKKGIPIGTFYITFDNYIGINLIEATYKDYINVIKYILDSETPLEEIKSVRNKNFLINTNPENLVFKKAIKELNFVHLQNTYLCKDKGTE